MPHRTTVEDAAILAEIPLFRFVPTESIQGILAECSVLQLKRGEPLWTSGQTDHNLYILLSGALTFHYGIGDDYPVEISEQGEIMGEMLWSGQEQTPASVVARMESRLLVMDEYLIWSLAQVSHAAACNLLSILLSRLSSVRSGVNDQERQYHQASAVDALTGLHSRSWMDQAVQRQLQRSIHTGRPLSMIVMDVDLFKDFIERHGRLCGDWAIHSLAQSLREYLRPTEMVARYGGDRFVILLNEVEVDGARQIAERLRNKIERTLIAMPDGRVLPYLSVSIGIAQSGAGDDSNSFMSAAAAAMRRAKQAGRNLVSE